MTNTIKVELTMQELEVVYAALEAASFGAGMTGSDVTEYRAIMGKLAVAAQQQVENDNV